MITLRKATVDDLEEITEIYNEAIINTTATFDTQPKNLEEQKLWFQSHQPNYPILVAQQGKLIVGWSSLSKWSDRCAYIGTAEASIYIRKDCRGKGIGSQLLRALLREGKDMELHTVIARIAGNNNASMHLFESEDFQRIGVMKEVGRKFGDLIDVCLMQKIYKK